jgi:AcrR family transcriptional regulator
MEAPISSPSGTHDIQETRQRLLEAAGEVIAEKGFRAATIREICRRAGANVAAVNYHFGDKERLYIAVLHHTFSVANQNYPLDQGVESGVCPEERLHAFVRAYLLRLLDNGRRVWHGKLIARELFEPTPALSLIVDEMVHPLLGRLIAIVRDFLGESAEPETVKLFARSILGQCLFYFQSRSIIELMNPTLTFDREKIEAIGDHICRFSLAALKQAGNHPAAENSELSEK